ncbi:AzlD domain-containing protein [Rhizobium sp. SSA_523]|uniref:AzlD domain-containing protein n=1 Tax=Rhizobium sp. SSA_523 TaxID=2952477 RepID=UPI0020905EB0|nr:AzlD domain-containing protein [Rhizobium sp. SSA_523]MCO5733931.1 AzlD domain-containing protein [Rhizobium sp. SSA_523]WKC24806.1 AzlD domain-containing protein [Rhizobium sp. SSA_523]
MSDGALWVYVVIIVAGWLATDLWRWLGVLVGNRLDEDSEALQWVRAVATALVMAVTSKLVFFPTGALADSPLWLRVGALGCGFLAFLLSGQRVIVCVGVSIALLMIGLALL